MSTLCSRPPSLHRRPRVWRRADETGQTLSELLMILGLLTSIMIVVTGIVVPALRATIGELAIYQSVYMTSTTPAAPP